MHIVRTAVPGQCKPVHTWMLPKGCQRGRERSDGRRRWLAELQLGNVHRKLINNSFVVFVLAATAVDSRSVLQQVFLCFTPTPVDPQLTMVSSSSTWPAKKCSLHKAIRQNAASVNYQDSLFNYLIYSVYSDWEKFDCHSGLTIGFVCNGWFALSTLAYLCTQRRQMNLNSNSAAMPNLVFCLANTFLECSFI